MNKAVLLFTIFIVALAVPSLATDRDDYKPSWIESWDGTQGGILHNFWYSLNPFNPDKDDIDQYENADYLGWYNGTPFRLANWEREVCLMDLSPTVRNIRNTAHDETNPETSAYTTTISLTAKKTFIFNTTYLYEVSYYILPFSESVDFAVYLYKPEAPSVREYVAGKSNLFLKANKLKGKNWYEAKYLTANFTKAVLEYKEVGNRTFEVSIVAPGN